MPELPPGLPALPPELPRKGVLLVQVLGNIMSPTRDKIISKQAQAKFLEHLSGLYSARGLRLIDEPYQGQPEQLQKIKALALGCAVRVQTEVNGHHDLIQQLTREGIVVSLIGVTGTTTARAQLSLPFSNGDPEPVKIDLTPYVEVDTPEG